MNDSLAPQRIGASQEPPKQKFSNVLIVSSILVVILLLIGGILFMSLNKAPSRSKSEFKTIPTTPIIAGNNQATFKYREENVKIFASQSAKFEQSINNLKITNALIEVIRDDPNYLQGERAVFNFPNYSNLSNLQARESFRGILVERLSSINGEVDVFSTDLKLDLSASLGKLLDLLSYIAKLNNSPHLDDNSRASWKTAVTEGKNTVASMLNLMGDYKIEGAKWIEENVYSKEEFKD